MSVVEDFLNLYSTNSRKGEKKECIIQHGNPVKILWDMWVLLLLVIISLIVPARLAFATEEPKSWMIFYLTIDAFFFVDIILTFFTSINDDKKVYEITDKRTIARTYLRGWFWIDVVSIIPLDFILLTNTNNATVLARFAKIGKLYKLIRMIRLAKVLKLLKKRNTVV